ncbi:MAG: TraX family protein [Candidatus Pristimantibacillus sp.]
MQIIAMLTMLFDHIGITWFPNDATLRVIGRLALPLYAYALVIGYQRTRNVNRYLWRTLLIAAISQIPYSLAFNTLQINTVGTLFICLVLLWGLDKYKGKLVIQSAFALLAILFLEVVPSSYGAYLPALVLIYRYASTKWMVALHIVLNFIFLYYQSWTVQLFSLFATILLVHLPLFLKAADRIYVPRIVWRSFYPLHLALIVALDYWVIQ